MFQVNDGIFLRFYCQTTTPFHTTSREYTNLVKSASFILGSTIRGAVLKTMIELFPCPMMNRLKDAQNSKEVSDIHSQCSLECPVKPFFTYPSQCNFSFGFFKAEDVDRFSTRIGIERQTASVAEGSIVTFESITPEKQFSFDVILFGECMNALPLLKTAVKVCGETEGIGRYRSIGYGKFKLDKAEEESFMDSVKSKMNGIDRVISDKIIKITFKTPFVIGNGMEIYPLKNRELIEKFSRDLLKSVNRVVRDTSPINIENIEFGIKPDFISRFSYENGMRENRLVAGPESVLTLHLREINDTLTKQLIIASILGIGEWNEWGFGRFNIV